MLEAFVACATQWRTLPMGGVLGLDYSAMEVALKAMRMDLTPELFAGLQVMEATVVRELSRRRD